MNDILFILFDNLKKVSSWLLHRITHENRQITHKQNIVVTDKRITNNITFYNCQFNNSPKSIIESLNKTKKKIKP